MDRPTDECLTLKLWQTEAGYWAYGIYTGDGSVAGSLKAGAGTFSDAHDALYLAGRDLERQIQYQECEHDWSGSKIGAFPTCAKCGLYDWDGTRSGGGGT